MSAKLTSGDLEPRLRHAVAHLTAHFEGDVLETEPARAALAHDFGGLVERLPALVLRPRSEADVVRALELAAKHQLPITTRGAGHSQSGQGLGSGLLLDMTSFDRVLSVDSDAQTIVVEGGARWSQVVAAADARGFLPKGLTHALDPTVAGTLSVAGVGAQAHLHGPQVDNVEWIDVATLDGEVHRCSPNQDSDLFDAVRAGLGQCGVILRVGYPLRARQPFVRVRCFAYAEPSGFLKDMASLSQVRGVGLWLTGTIAQTPFNHRPLLLLWVGQELDSADAEAQGSLPSLEADLEMPSKTFPIWTSNGLPGHPFFRVFGPATPGAINPWVEHVFASSLAGSALTRLLERLPQLVGRGKAGVIPLCRGNNRAPLFRTPQDELLFGLGIFGSFPKDTGASIGPAVAAHAIEMRRAGGVRYLSGFVTDNDARGWAEHYGAAWLQFQTAKQHFDPEFILGNGFLDWELSETPGAA